MQRKLGEYWRSLDVRSIASGGILLWNICTEQAIREIKLTEITDEEFSYHYMKQHNQKEDVVKN